MLELRNVVKHYRDKTALNGLQLEVKQGEIFVLLGPTGAGKTTTLRCIAGLDTINLGAVLLEGEDITTVNTMDRDMAMVFEGFNLLPLLSVRDNIAFPLRSDIYRQEEKEIQHRVAAVAKHLRIDHLLERDVLNLSGGEQQRVAIARTIVRRPKMYLLDEPLSALDLKLREELRVELRQLHEHYQSTIVYATHDYHGAAAIADRIGIIHEGKLYQSDTLEKLYQDPAHVVVGQLIGSPAMAFFPAQLIDGHIALQDTVIRISLEHFAGNADFVTDPMLLGMWPEDIEIALQELPNFQPATIYATDYRGMDRAVQVQTGCGFFRKVVAMDFPAMQGDACWYRLNTLQGFWFDAQSGKRLDLSSGVAK